MTDDAALRAHVRRGLWRGLAGLVGLFLAVGVAGVICEKELLAFTTWAYATLGFPGLAGILLVSDTFTSPVPPQLVLLVIANSPLHAHWKLLMPALALQSAVAGTLGYFMATRLGHTRFGHVMVGRLREENRELIDRWGTLGLVLCALTPIPYSISCWVAGALHVRFRSFVWVPILRVPRFLLYYVVIAFADDVLRALF
jgi:membrane protein YqaA with SNARE-associated domain